MKKFLNIFLLASLIVGLSFSPASSEPFSWPGMSQTPAPYKIPQADADGDIDAWVEGGGAATFLDLTDAPDAYIGEAGKYVKVNTSEDGVEFDTPTGAGDMLEADYDTEAEFEANLFEIIVPSELDYFTGTDITGSEAAFEGWDKDASDDFDGNPDSLTGDTVDDNKVDHAIISYLFGTGSGEVAEGNHLHTGTYEPAFDYGTGVGEINTDDIPEGSSNLYDQTVSNTGDSDIEITGTYPNFTFSFVNGSGFLTSESDPTVDTQSKIETILGYGLNDSGTSGSDLWSASKIDSAIVAAGGYSDETAQDAIGTILDDGTYGNIVFTYNDPTPYISATFTAGTNLSWSGTTLNASLPSGTGAPTDADYWVGTANASLSAEIVVNDEASLYGALSDVTDFLQASDNVESMATAGGSGTAPVSDGASGLAMIDVWTEAENTAAAYISADSTDTLTNKTFDADGTGNSLSNVDLDDMVAGDIVTESEGISSNDNDTTLPTSAAVKAYADSVGGGSGGMNWSNIITTDTTASSGNGYFLGAEGNLTLTLPAAPAAGNAVGYNDFTEQAGTYTYTLAANGNNIEGSSEDLIIDTAGASGKLVYTNATWGWQVHSYVTATANVEAFYVDDGAGGYEAFNVSDGEGGYETFNVTQ